MIEPGLESISINQQCGLLGLSRSSYYYKPASESPENLELMRLIDEEYTKHPFYGARRFTAWLKNLGHNVNRKRVTRLMQIMGLEAIYPKKNLSKPSDNHKIYPYLLKDILIDKPNCVWSIDITYIRMVNGFMYLVAIIDWYSRYVLAWRLSNTLDVNFCIETLEEALTIACPDFFNSDQGSQFTSNAFIAVLEKHPIAISMDGKGRAYDNIFVERLWRSVKYEEIYLKDYLDPQEVRDGLEAYFTFYNNERLHQSLNYKTPKSIYIEGERYKMR
jgi:putative transposase